MAAVAGPTSPSEAPSKPGPFLSLRNRDFRWLWISTVAVGFGQWGQQIALGILVYNLTGSAVQLGGVTTASGVVSLSVTPFFGLLADRYSRRTIMVVSSSLGALQAGILAVLVLSDVVVVWHAYVFAVLTALTQAANQPARQAYVNDVSTPETLANAISLNSIAQNVSRIAGPPLAGYLAVLNVGAAFLFVAGIRGVATLATMLMGRRPHERTAGNRNPFKQILDGFAYLLSEPRLRLLLAINAVPALMVYPYMSMMPIFAEEVFHEPTAYGWLVAMIAVGSVVGLFALAWLGDIPRKTQIMLGCFLVYLVLVLLFTRTDLLWLALGTLIVAGLFHGVALALNNTVFQSEIRPDMRGRGMAAWQIGFGLMPLGGLPMGVLVDRVGIQDGVAIPMLACLAVFAMIVVFGRSLTRGA
ncbi:MAG: MFS transporter [Dehalococcoidia bacterium]|nr:MFS transporter [Dehalococcoidia bacterium]